jgi:uncharacterized damage-inducible protein DinB
MGHRLRCSPVSDVFPIPTPPPPPDPPFIADEQAMLVNWLDFHRDVLVRKCGDLSPEQLADANCGPSMLSLLGLLRHLAQVEQTWFQRGLANIGHELPYPTVEPLFGSEPDPDGYLILRDAPDPASDIATYREQVRLSREILAGVTSLDATFDRRGTPCSVRWTLVHMVEEYARHNGHADLLRERIDGRVGD